MRKEVVILTSKKGYCLDRIYNDSNLKDNNIVVRCLITDRDCDAIDVTRNNSISFFHLDKENDIKLNTNVLAILCHNADLIIVTDYLSKVPGAILNIFQKKMIFTNLSLNLGDVVSKIDSTKMQQNTLDAGGTEAGCFSYYLSDSEHIEIISQKVVKISLLDDAESLLKKVKEVETDLIINSIQTIL